MTSQQNRRSKQFQPPKMQSSQIRPSASGSKQNAATSKGTKPKTGGALVQSNPGRGQQGQQGKEVGKLPFDPNWNLIEKRRLPNGEIEYAPKGETTQFIHAYETKFMFVYS